MAEDNSEASGGESEPPTGAPFAPLGICARCHRPLTRPGPAGGCLHCIVDFVGLDEDLGFAPGPGNEEVRRYSHFEIALDADGSLAELGHGSMGTTYRAVDTVLQSSVALKVIGRNVADSPAVRSRFLREARTAAKLRHPNVASVFHYGEQEGECFYVMELVEGETLEERVYRAGPLPMPSVLEIGVQVARALEAAESQGLVHRDLKPSNLMLVRGHGGGDKPGDAILVKVIDFGLAKAVAVDEQAAGENDTRHGFVGTPAYASPEQFARNSTDSRVDTRSDIYSLGVTLWYLLSGRTPFRGSTLEDIHEQQVRQPLPLAQLSTKRVPAPVLALLRNMLAVHPRDRIQSAHELTGALARCQAQISPGRQRSIRRWIAAVCAVTLLGSALGWLVPRWRAQPPLASPNVPQSKPSVVVLPFENLSPDKSEAFFSSGIQAEITDRLARLPGLKVIGPESARAYPPGNRDYGKIGRELGVTRVVEGSVRREADHLHITVQLVEAKNPAKPWVIQQDGQQTDVFAILQKITSGLLTQLGAKNSLGSQATIEEPPTTDPVAYDLYLRATEAPTMFRGPDEFRQALNSRLSMLEEAVKRDPNFVRAYCAMAGMHDDMARASAVIVEERKVDHRGLAESALQKARRLKPDDGNVHLALAYHLRAANNDNEQARIESDLARATLPNDASLEQNAGFIAIRQGHWEEAAQCLERSLSLEPREPTTYKELAGVYRCMRRYEDADRVLARALTLELKAGGTYLRLLRATGPLEQRADLIPLKTALAELPPSENPDEAGDPDPFRLILALCTRDPEAVTRVLASTHQPKIFGENRIFASSGVYPKAFFEGMAARLRGDTEAARTAFGVSRTELEKMLQVNARDAEALSLLAVTDAGLERKEDAVREGREATELMPARKGGGMEASAVACNLAVVYAWTNQSDQAFALLDELVKGEAGMGLLFQPSYGDLRLNPVWDPLRGDAHFAALVERLAPK